MNPQLATINSGPLLAAAFGVQYSRLTYHLYKIPESSNYHEFSIPKKSGGARTITSPNEIRKSYQRKILLLLSNVYEPPSCAHGFIAGRGICSNAAAHVGALWVLNFDLKDFFSQIHFGRIAGLLQSRAYGLDEIPARLIAQTACYRSRLPQGAPTSPILANMIAKPLDSAISRLASRAKANYTRYADDLTISGRSFNQLSYFVSKINCSRTFYSHFEISGDLFELNKQLIEIIRSSGFAVNDNKTRLQIKNARKSVTGLVVNRKLNVPRQFVRATRAVLHAWNRYGYRRAHLRYLSKYRDYGTHHLDFRSFQRYAKGRIDYIGQVKGKNSPVYQKLYDAFYDLERVSFTDAYLARQPIDFRRRLRETVWVVHVEYTDFAGEPAFSQGTAFFVKNLGFLTCSHVLPPADLGQTNSALISVKIHPELGGSSPCFAKVVARDTTADVALLSLAKTASHSAPSYGLELDLAPSFLGNPTLTVAGFPNHSVMDNLYIAEGKHLQIKKKAEVIYHSLSARISQGASGGPVLSSDGMAVGIATRGIVESEENSSAGDTLFSGFVSTSIAIPAIMSKLAYAG